MELIIIPTYLGASTGIINININNSRCFEVDFIVINITFNLNLL